MTHTRSHKLFATVALTVLSWTSTLLLTTPATAETPTDAEIAPLIEQLKVADEFTRGDRVTALAEVGAPAVPALIKALQSDNFLIRQGAAEALSQIGDPAVPDLLKSLESDSPRVRGITATNRTLGHRRNSPTSARSPSHDSHFNRRRTHPPTHLHPSPVAGNHPPPTPGPHGKSGTHF
ncbi:HEAT repeat domain-containing protein [Phormidium pseudopriestleyi FRX01]|uniref:HEAT repeat domain-containing protein n=1 Tax=Phormidium pseudopriestleyi FRX01 TaxID=1759528 RepID=A0ABS3FXJ7_9CYAN|nr:HEAT repeat domain-containing protein [Phormidium pseudopriestleyi]MBO0351854.1 HEAT repeat domain-containing protein [Phormidium pseudopriestleyi FRX01]